MDRIGGHRLVAITAVIGVGALWGAPGALRAGDPAWEPPPCAPGVLGAAAGARAAGAGAGVGTWFAVAPDIDRRGELAGQDVRVGSAGDARGRRLPLPPESFATGPAGGFVLVGDDDGTRSRLRLVDPGLGCAVAIGDAGDVIRGALVTPGGDAIVEHRVDRATREDLGVWRRPLGGGPPEPVLAPFPADAAVGPVFATELAWGTDGRLAVASCGELTCRVRVVDLATGVVIEAGHSGPLVGLAGDEVVAYDTCPGLPCTLEAIELRTGVRRTIVEAAGLAALAGVRGALLAYETAPGEIRVVDLATEREVRSGRLPGGAAPVRRTSGIGFGATVPPGWLAVLAVGEADAPGFAALDPDRFAVRPLVEVVP